LGDRLPVVIFRRQFLRLLPRPHGIQIIDESTLSPGYYAAALTAASAFRGGAVAMNVRKLASRMVGRVLDRQIPFQITLGTFA